MNPAAWVFLGTSLILAAMLLVVLLGAASAQADAEKRYLRLGQKLLRSEQVVRDQVEEIATLRRKLIRLVGGRPVQSVDTAARIASGLRAAQEAASIDDEWANLNGKGDAS